MAVSYLWQKENWPHFYYHNGELLPLLLEINNLQRQLAMVVTKPDFSKQQDLNSGMVGPNSPKAAAEPIGPLTKKWLCAWWKDFCPADNGQGRKCGSGSWRTTDIEVLFGPQNGRREQFYYVAPPAVMVDDCMTEFLCWFNNGSRQNLLIKAAIAYLWLWIIQPFAGENGTLALVICNSLLARADNAIHGYYNLAAAVNRQQAGYYSVLEQTCKGDLDITNWLIWFLSTLKLALTAALSENLTAG